MLRPRPSLRPAVTRNAPGLAIDWREGTLEDLAVRRPAFDAVVALEIVEHVANREAFVDACVRCVRPGGLVIFSTLNRTLRSLALAKIGAEYVLGWIPKGTHDFGKFVKPAELARDFRQAGARLTDVTGSFLSRDRQQLAALPQLLDQLHGSRGEKQSCSLRLRQGIGVRFRVISQALSSARSALRSSTLRA